MPAAKKNTNAQKWTEKKVLKKLAKIKQAADDPKNLFIGQQLKKMGLYKNIWAYWKRKYKDNEDLLDQIDLVEGMYESNVYRAGCRREIPVRVCILTLRNAHGWRNNPKDESQSIVRSLIPAEIITAAGKEKKSRNKRA